MYGSIRRPSVLQKYVPIGDSVYGGTEELITLNSFMISGNILYPQKYDKLVEFTSLPTHKVLSSLNLLLLEDFIVNIEGEYSVS